MELLIVGSIDDSCTLRTADRNIVTIGNRVIGNTDIRQFRGVDYTYWKRFFFGNSVRDFRSLKTLTFVSFNYVKTDSGIGNPQSTVGAIPALIGTCPDEKHMNCGTKICPFHELHEDHAADANAKLNCLITDTVKQVRFAKDDVLFAQGQPSSSVYSLGSGIVKISKTTADGREQIVGLSAPGKLLVGLQSINDEKYEYTAVAETEVAACKIRHRALLQAVQNRGDIALRLISSINAQLAQSRSLMEVMGRKCAAAKIASLIKLIIPSSAHGDKPFLLPFSRSEIADLLGLSEETVCRQMARMKRRGILYAPRGKIEILDWDQLRAVASEPCAPD